MNEHIFNIEEAILAPEGHLNENSREVPGLDRN